MGDATGNDAKLAHFVAVAKARQELIDKLKAEKMAAQADARYWQSKVMRVEHALGGWLRRPYPRYGPSLDELISDALRP